MDEEIIKKLDEINKKVDDKNKAKESVEKQEEHEKSRLDREFQQKKENLLNEIKKELDLFEPKLLPLRRPMYDGQDFYLSSNIRCRIVATEDQRIGTSGSYPKMFIGGYPSIFHLADNSELQSCILDILRSFLNGLNRFEKYYVDNVEKYLK